MWGRETLGTVCLYLYCKRCCKTGVGAGQSIVQMARQGEHGHEYAIKFFVKKEAFVEESGIYCNRGEGLGRHSASLMLPQARP